MRTLRHVFVFALGLSVLGTGSVTAQTAGDEPLALRPDSVAPLEGTTWRLRDYRLRGIERSSGPEVAAWMTLHAGKLKGSGGCDPIRGRYGVMGGALSIELGRVKTPDCAEQTTMVQLGMVDGLRRAASYEIVPADESSGDELVLLGAQGTELLRFVIDDMDEPEGGQWRLEAFTMGGERTLADPDQPALLTFQRARVKGAQRRSEDAQRRSEGDLVGSTGCNGLVAEYFRHADVLSFGELEVTDAPCPEALAAQEAAIIGVLDATALSVDLPPDRLLLVSSDTGDSLELATTAPLEETTWQLSRLPDAPPLVFPVTLRLADGRASGQGPCGPYSADYVTDGVFITFDDIAATAESGPSEEEACPDEAAERALLSALRATVLVERDRPQLRLLDATGQVTARFKPAGGR